MLKCPDDNEVFVQQRSVKFSFTCYVETGHLGCLRIVLHQLLEINYAPNCSWGIILSAIIKHKQIQAEGFHLALRQYILALNSLYTVPKGCCTLGSTFFWNRNCFMWQPENKTKK